MVTLFKEVISYSKGFISSIKRENEIKNYIDENGLEAFLQQYKASKESDYRKEDKQK